MKQISETNRLAEAVAGVAATITEIIDAPCNLLRESGLSRAIKCAG
jgi:hypothetical protein